MMQLAALGVTFTVALSLGDVKQRIGQNDLGSPFWMHARQNKVLIYFQLNRVNSKKDEMSSEICKNIEFILIKNRLWLLALTQFQIYYFWDARWFELQLLIWTELSGRTALRHVPPSVIYAKMVCGEARNKIWETTMIQHIALCSLQVRWIMLPFPERRYRLAQQTLFFVITTLPQRLEVAPL